MKYTNMKDTNQSGKFIDRHGWSGKYKFKFIDKDTGKIREEMKYNKLLDTALNEMAKALYDGSNDFVPTYIGLGTQSATIYNTMTNMGSETFRTYIGASPTISGTGEVMNVFYVLSTEALFHVKELGLWGGSTATSTIGTGKLLSYITFEDDRSAKNEEIQIFRYDKFERSV